MSSKQWTKLTGKTWDWMTSKWYQPLLSQLPLAALFFNNTFIGYNILSRQWLTFILIAEGFLLFIPTIFVEFDDSQVAQQVISNCWKQKRIFYYVDGTCSQVFFSKLWMFFRIPYIYLCVTLYFHTGRLFHPFYFNHQVYIWK